MISRLTTGEARGLSAEKACLDLLEQIGVEVGGDRPCDIHVHDTRLWERVIKEREFGLAEAYQEGWWDANELDVFLALAQSADLRNMVKRSPKLVAMAARSVIGNRQSVKHARANASAHYDIGNDLYQRMLDKRMIYSCAYWSDAQDLDSAQEAKLDLICRKLGLEQGMTMLDIGCGWGGLSQFAAERYDVRVTGISPAGEQVKLAKERCDGLAVDIRQLDYREIEGRFDRIVSVGMMEHVGPRNFPTFFDKCAELLEPDGMMLHHTIGSNVSKKTVDPWFEKYIFPGGVLPSMHQITGATESKWSLEDVHNFGPDYDRTLMEWKRNIDARWSEIPAYDEHFRRTWNYYLAGSAASFRVRIMQLWQVVFTRSKREMPRYESVR